MISISKLYALQESDSELQSKRAALSDAEAGIGESDEVSEVRREADERKEALQEAERRFKESETEADDLRAKIEPLERRLYEGGVVNPKELEDLEQDIASLRRRRSELEDIAIAAMEELEEAQQAASESEAQAQDSAASWTTEQTDLEGRKEALKKEIAELEERRNERAADVDESLLRLYDHLLDSHEGRAVVKVQGGTCGGCRISLPMNVLQHARAGNDVVQCTNCERILYVT